jgi:hypothetical protein
MMEAIHSSETSVLTRTTWRNIPEDGILHSHRRENLKFYKAVAFFKIIFEICSACCLLHAVSSLALLFDPEDVVISASETSAHSLTQLHVTVLH